MSASQRQFRIGECLGRGGFGEVYRATMSSAGGIQATVAVKVLRADLGAEADAMRRLRDEGRLLARLHHPSILKVYDMVTLDERVTLVAEYVEGADLAEWCCKIPARPLLQVVAAVAGALDAAFSAVGQDGQPLRLVHRDIKPTNIRMGRHGEIKVLDFGIAHFQGSEREARTDTGLVVGSLPYMAPERFRSPSVDPASDVFSLGCTVYECLTGERFLGDGNLRAVSKMALRPERFAAHAEGRMALLSNEDPRVLELLGSLLAYEPSVRPSADEVSSRCEALADELGGPSLRTWCRAQPWPELAAHEGPLVGRLITEGALQISDGHVQSAQPGPVIHRTPQETLDEPGPLAVPMVEPTRSRGAWIALGCVGLAVVSLLASGVLSVVAAGVGVYFL